MLFPPVHTTIDKAHGRLELRHVWTSTELNGYIAFPYVAQCFCIQRDITKLTTGKQHVETVYGVTSLSPDKADPLRILNLARGHWAIENRLHWVRDVTFDEDRSQVRKKNGAHIMASIRNIAISLLRIAGACNIAKALRACSMLGQGVLRLIGITDLL
jgi:hypothetical protein